jgi:hypothetical protein
MKRISIAVFSFIAVALFFAASAFTKNNNKKQTVYEHFQYIGATYSEPNFENDANWSSLGTTNPSTNPCADGNVKTCVMRIDQSLLSTDPDLSLPEKAALYLQNESGTTGATDFVNSNFTHRKP